MVGDNTGAKLHGRSLSALEAQLERNTSDSIYELERIKRKSWDFSLGNSKLMTMQLPGSRALFNVPQ
jgi:hypothetical protein